MPSTAIANFNYDPKRKILAVTFLSGNLYYYKAVPQMVYNGLKAAMSKGRYFNDFIKNKFEFEHVSTG